MTKYSPWLSYSGDARIWLAIGLLIAATAVAYAGIRLPLPARPARPGKKAAIAMIVVWAAAVVALLSAAVVFIRQYIHAYTEGMAPSRPTDHVAPVTFTAVVVVFVIILTRSQLKDGMKLVSAIIGAIAAPFIFELPFDLIIMFRTHTQDLIGPSWEIALLFALLILVDITTLLLLRLSPMVRVTRATFYSFALMLGVFAIWGLKGFGYPSAPVPLTLNIVSKLLAFVTAVTLFFPQRPSRRQTAQLPAATLATATTPVSEDSGSQPVNFA